MLISWVLEHYTTDGDFVLAWVVLPCSVVFLTRAELELTLFALDDEVVEVDLEVVDASDRVVGLVAVHSLDVSALIDGLAEVWYDCELLEGPINDLASVLVGSRSVLSCRCERGRAQTGVQEANLCLNLLLVSSGTRIIREFSLQRVFLGRSIKGIVVRLDREAIDEGCVLEDLRASQSDTFVLRGNGELATLSWIERGVLNLDGKVSVLWDEVHISGGNRVLLIVEGGWLDRDVCRVYAWVLYSDWHLNRRILAVAVVVARLLLDGHVDRAR